MNDFPRRRAAPVARVRLVDVARESGLSKTTISAALNGTGRLSPEVRERAKEAARRLGYRPNPTARLLRVGHTRVIGLAVREFTTDAWAYTESAYYAQLTQATARAALAHGYALMLLPTSSGRDDWTELPMDAVIIADPMVGDPLIEDFIAARIPLFTDRSVEGRRGAHWVDIDTEFAIQNVLEHLAEQGAREIGVIVPDSQSRFHTDSLATYDAWCAERGLTPRVTVGPHPGGGPAIDALAQVFAAPDRPDALLVLTEVNPLLAVETARRHGVRIPEDMLLVMAGADATAPYADPPVTTLNLQPEAVALAGIELLVAALETGSDEPTGELVRTALEVRASSLRKR